MTKFLRFHTPSSIKEPELAHSLIFETTEGPNVEIIVGNENWRFLASVLKVDMEEELIALVTRMRYLQKQLEEYKSLPAAMLVTTAENIVDMYLEQLETYQRMMRELGEE